MDKCPEIEFTIPGIPTAWARAGTKGRVHFTPGKQRRSMSVVQVLASDAMGDRPPLSGPVAMTVTACWPWPKSMSQRKRSAVGANYRTARPDADNVGKLIADAINGITFGDDAQVVDLRVKKLFGLSAFTRVVIESLSGEGGA